MFEKTGPDGMERGRLGSGLFFCTLRCVFENARSQARTESSPTYVEKGWAHSRRAGGSRPPFQSPSPRPGVAEGNTRWPEKIIRFSLSKPPMTLSLFYLCTLKVHSMLTMKGMIIENLVNNKHLNKDFLILRQEP